MLLVPVYLDRSPLEGIGLFAKRPIAKGTLIWRLDETIDSIFSHAHYETLPDTVRDYLDRYSYPSKDRPGHYVFEGDDAKYMNHSAAPNCDFSDGKAAYALKDIAAREEMTCDYAGLFGGAAFEMLGER